MTGVLALFSPKNSIKLNIQNITLYFVPVYIVYFSLYCASNTANVPVVPLMFRKWILLANIKADRRVMKSFTLPLATSTIDAGLWYNLYRLLKKWDNFASLSLNKHCWRTISLMDIWEFMYRESLTRIPGLYSSGQTLNRNCTHFIKIC